MITLAETERRADVGAWLRNGIVAGIAAGIVFAMFEMVMAAALNGADAFFNPLRMIGGIGLGKTALDPATSVLSAGGAGLVIHMIMSMIYGIVAAAVLSLVPQLSVNGTTVLVSASVAGLALWILNFYGFAPALGWSWFPDKANPVVQFFAHTFFFGTVLGYVLDRTYLSRLRG